MPVTLSFQAGLDLDLVEVVCVRSLGNPVSWRFLVEVQREGPGGELGQKQLTGLSNALLGGAAMVSAAWQPAGLVICPSARIVGARWSSRTGTVGEVDIGRQQALSLVELDAESTAVDKSPDPFTPRRRVLKAKNMLDLVEKFAGVARPLKSLRGDLQQISFPEGDKSCIIQDGVSDWIFLGHILDQCRMLNPGASWLPLTLLGSMDTNAGTDGRWVIGSGASAAYSSWGEVAGRTVRFEESESMDGFERFDFGEASSLCRAPDFPGALAPTVAVRHPERKITAARWTSWTGGDVPRFTEQGNMVYRIDDRIFRAADGDTRLGWDTRTYAVPPQFRIAGPIPERPLSPWLGLGKVQETSASGPWISVQLPGFESGSDVADVRLSTPYSGKNGKRGLHFVPETGTEVEIGWTGRFDAPIVLVGNMRRDSAEFDSPSVYLESTHKAQYADINSPQIGNMSMTKIGDVSITKIGDVSVDSSLSMAVKQTTTVNSQQKLEINADGANLKMSGGTVYTGRGF
jgi:hypothetical protein